MTRLSTSGVLIVATSLGLNHLGLAGDSPRRRATLSHQDEAAPVQGRLGLPLRSSVVVQGLVVRGPSKGYEDGPNIVVQRIDGRAIQDHLQIKLSGLIRKPTSKAARADQPLSIEWAFEFGKTYELRGFEHGTHVGGGPPNSQTTSRYFQHLFEVEEQRQTKPISFSPADFVDRKALLQGTALNVESHPYLVGDGWLIRVANAEPWSRDFLGKQAEALGTVRAAREPGLFELENSTTHLVHLRDQIGKRISLRGTAWSMSGEWWFDYRGRGIHVEGMRNLPGWNAENHARPIQLDGILDVADLPHPEHRLRESDPRIAKRFIVRQASWKPTSPLLAPEREHLADQ